MMIACGTQISENANWTILERAQSDRGNNFLPSNPAIYGWRMGSARGGIVSHFHVPSSFSCPSGLAVGRWLWKAAQNCNDFNNVRRDTETFMPSEQSSGHLHLLLRLQGHGAFIAHASAGTYSGA